VTAAAPGSLYVPLAHTRRLLSVRDALRVTEEVFAMHARGEITMCEPPRFTIHGRTQPIYSHVKGCVLESIPIMGVRVVAYVINPDGSGTSAPQSTRVVLLTDPRTGVLLAMVDEHWNYSIRTTAAAVIGAKYLARRDAHVAGIVGAGNLARTGLLALRETFPLTAVRVASRRPESAARFAAEMSGEIGLPVERRDTVREVCEGADLIFVATTAGTPLVMGDWVAPGVCVVTVGNDEIDHRLYGSADKVVADEVDDVATLLRPVVQTGLMREGGIYGAIWEVVAGRKPGRERPDERIVIKTVGLVSQDVAVAHHVYRKAMDAGLGFPLNG
jgi:alanine dehydrogenase